MDGGEGDGESGGSGWGEKKTGSFLVAAVDSGYEFEAGTNVLEREQISDYEMLLKCTLPRL